MSKELSERVCRKMGIRPDKVYKMPLDFRREDQAGAYEYPDLDTPEWAGRLLVMLSNCGLFPACKQPLGGRTGYSARAKVWEVEIIDPRQVPRQIDRSQARIYGGASESLAEAICLAIDVMPDAVLNGSERMDS